MSSVEYLRTFVNERLTAAAEEIFRVFSKTIVEYEEEIDRQRKLLETFWQPEINLHRIELPQHHGCKVEEVLSDQQLCIKQRNSSLDQEDPEPPHIKEEQEELCTSQEVEQLEVKQETETFMWTPTDEESDHSEDQTLDFNPDKGQSVAETELPASMCISWLKEEPDWENPEVSEPNSDHQLLSHNSHVAESYSEAQTLNFNSDDTVNAAEEESVVNMPVINAEVSEPNCDHQLLSHNSHVAESSKSTSHSNNVNNSNLLKIHCNTQASKQSFKCDTCGEDFKYKSVLFRHLRIHTGEKPHSCNVCGKRFGQISALNVHMAIHTDEKPYSCQICGKNFRYSSNLTGHMKTHTGEKPHSCNTCGKDFTRRSTLVIHIRRAHTGEKPYFCNICGKRYCDSSQLAAHRKSHLKYAGDNSVLVVHGQNIKKLTEVRSHVIATQKFYLNHRLEKAPDDQ